MAYLQSYRGDYRGGYGSRGDPGLFGFLGGAVRKVGRVVTRAFVPPPIRAIAETIMPGPAIAPSARMPQMRMPAVTETRDPGYARKKREAAGLPPKRRRMNPGNAKALRRAIRRQESFVKLARKALKGTKSTITTRGSRSRAVKISEHGPGGVTVR